MATRNGDSARESKGTPSRVRGFRPNPRRQILFILIVLAAVLGGYLIGVLLIPADETDSRAPNQVADARPVDKPQPWYKTQAPPPQMVTAPDLPIFPDPVDEAEGPLRAYEEALPEEIYEPPPRKPVPPPVDAGTGPEIQTVTVVPPPAAADRQGLAAWQRFALASPAPDGRPRIALVIDDMGVDRGRSARIMALAGPLTLSFLTYAKNLEEQTARARAGGHELMLHVPMEPRGRNVDPGPNVLLTDIEPPELERRLSWNFARFSDYVGINNHMGSRFTSDVAGVTMVMEELKRRG